MSNPRRLLGWTPAASHVPTLTGAARGLLLRKGALGILLLGDLGFREGPDRLLAIVLPPAKNIPG